MKQVQYFLFVVFLFPFQITSAQNDSTTNQKAQLRLSVNYNSRLNYYGRTDSLKSSGFFPLAEIWFNKEVYINAAPVFVNNALQSFEYAGTITSLGYLHSSDKWITNLYALKPFYKKNSQLPQSALQAQAGANFSFLNKFINLIAGGDIKYSDKIDFGATAGIDRTIRKQFNDKTVLVIDPSFYTYAGTQNFTNTYYKKNPNFLFIPGSPQQTTENVQNFNILAYELSIPIVYVKGKWMILITPSYILPQNLIKVPNRPDLSEKGDNMFYATIALKHSF